MSLSNSSQSSNVFVLSSDESSLAHSKGNKKQKYAAFAHKVKLLLQVEQDDLNQLYHKIQIIVKRYFDEHKIVEFRDMYDHIIALKSNSKRMSLIVSVLQKRLLEDHEIRVRQQKHSLRTQKNDDFQLTSSTHKENTKPTSKIQNKGRKLSVTGTLNDSTDIANTTDHHNRTPKSSESTEEKEQSRQGRFSKMQKEQSSPSRSSLTKLNSSFQQYQNRNKQYEQKVKILMQQLQGIKKSITSKHKTAETTQNTFGQQRSDSQQNLQINLKSNHERLQGRSQSTIIDNCAEKYFTFNGNSKESLPSYKLQRKKDLQETKPKSKQSLPNSGKIIKENDKQSNKNSQKQDISIRYALPTDSPVKTSQKSINLLQYSANISKQIQQLKQVASRLQLQSNRTVNSQKIKQNDSPQPSQEIISQRRLTNLIKKASQQKKQQPILQIIENTTSQHQLSENTLSPSFKYIDQRPLPDSSSMNNNYQQDRSSSSQHSNSHMPPSNILNYPQNRYFNPNNPSYTVDPQQLPIFSPHFPQHPHNVQTVKVIYNPYPVNNLNLSHYPNSVIQPQPFKQLVRNPQQVMNKSISSDSLYRIVNPSILGMTNSHNNSTTSIMHPHLFNNRSNLIPLPENSSNNRIQTIGLNSANRSQNNNSFHNISQISSALPQYNSIRNSTELKNMSNLSNSSHKRRGLNLISPSPKQTQ